MMVESATECSFVCMQSTPRRRTGSCADSDPCTDDTPVPSATSCTYDCPRALARAGTSCGGWQNVHQYWSMRGPPAFCGDGTVAETEQCDDGNEDTTDGCIDCNNARCGDGYVKSSEECDYAAPGWASICGTPHAHERCTASALLAAARFNGRKFRARVWGVLLSDLHAKWRLPINARLSNRMHWSLPMHDSMFFGRMPQRDALH